MTRRTLSIAFLVVALFASCLLPSDAKRPCPHKHKSPPKKSKAPPSPLFGGSGQSPYGVCSVNHREGVQGCTYDDGSQVTNARWRDCIHDVDYRCGQYGATATLSAKSNINSACPNCILWACAQNPKLPLVFLDNKTFDFTLNKTCRANQILWFPPKGADSAYAILRGAGDFNWDHFLAVPSKPVWGVDDPNKVNYDFVWDKAWEERSYTKAHVSVLEWAAGINNRRLRGMQQMHIHSCKLVSGNRARIDTINTNTASIQLLNAAGQNVPATIVVWDKAATNPSDLHPFVRYFPVKSAPPLQYDNSGADHALAITAGPSGRGLILFDIGLAPVDGPTGIFAGAVQGSFSMV